MKKLKVLAVLSAVGIAALSTSGCSWTQRGAAGLGLAGTAAGAAIGNATVAAPVTGGIIGGTSGAAVGGLAGDAFDQVTKNDMERELENLRAEVTNKETEIASLKASGLSTADAQELADSRARLATLETELAAAQARIDEAAQAVETSSLTRSALEQEVSAKLDEAEALRTQLSEAEARNQMTAAEVARLTGEAETLRVAVAEKEARLAELDGKVNILQTSLQGKQAELAELSSELQTLNVQLEETNRGLTLTIAESLLYNAGKAELTTDGKKLLGDVARILNEKFPKNEFVVEGHTDNQPIVRSGWRSNWELGAGRALSMVHELVEVHGIDASRVSATSFGEFRPTATNATVEGRRLNRRAVIVILPEELPLQRQNLAQASTTTN